jgi:hypothetical protein
MTAGLRSGRPLIANDGGAEMQIHVDSEAIETIADWFRLAPPKGKEAHWKDGFSAKELARAWCGPNGVCVPAELSALLASNATLGSVVLEDATPEYKIAFDDLPGERRNTDLVATGQANGKRVAVSVEAKAAEPFSERVAAMLNSSAIAIANEKWTNIPQRIQQLGRALLHVDKNDSLPRLGELRYQLLTATAGALAFAKERDAQAAVLVVHEFLRTTADPKQIANNAADLNQFVQRVSRGTVSLVAGQLAGPFTVPGNQYIPAKIPLYIGKIQTLLV